MPREEALLGNATATEYAGPRIARKAVRGSELRPRQATMTQKIPSSILLFSGRVPAVHRAAIACRYAGRSFARQIRFGVEVASAKGV
jgi:hypothetical protein